MELFQSWRAFSLSPRAGRAGGLAALALLGLFAAGAAQAQTITVSLMPSRVSESRETTLRIERSTPSTTDITLTWRLVAGSTASNDDFVNFFGGETFTIRASPGTRSRGYLLTINDDSTFEGDETAIFMVSCVNNCDGVNIVNQQVTLTIVDDDQAIFTVTGPTMLTETDSDAMTDNYTITRTGPAVITGAVSWNIGHRTTSAADFSATSGTVTFTADDNTETFTLTVVGDNLIEGDETFFLNTNPPSGHFMGADFDVTIADDDTATFTVTGPAMLTETDSDAMTSNYTITRTGPAITGTVGWSIAHGTTADGDFSAASGTVTFTAGDNTQTFALTVIGDNLAEGDETFTLNATPPNNHSAGPAHSVTIADDDTEFTVTGPVTLTETDADASSGDYTITRSGAALTASTDVTWTITHDAASGTDDNDFTGATTGMVTFAAGDNSQTFSFTITGDNTSESDEGFSLGLSAAGHTAGSDLSVTITDDDNEITFALAAPAGPAAEGSAPAFTVTYTIGDGSALAAAATLTADVLNDVPDGHNFSATGEERAFADDFDGGRSAQNEGGGTVIATTMVTIPMGTAHNTSLTFSLPTVTDDGFAERQEHYRVRLSGGPSSAIFVPAHVQHTIAASDALMLSVAAPSESIDVTEGGSGGAVRVNFTNLPTSDPWERSSSVTTIKIAYEANGTAMESPDITWADVRSNGYAEIDFAGNDDGTPGLHRMFNDVTITGVNAFNFNANVAAHDAFSVTVRDDDPQSWVALAIDPGGLPSADVQEDASPHTDPNAAGNADDSYFRILVWTGLALNPNVRARTVLTYCIYGTARGGFADDTGRDYTWPNGYDPAADVSSMNGNCDSGSGTLTFAANAEEQYRVPLVLNDDALNEAAETILIDTVSAVSDEGYRNVVEHSFYTGENSVATRTIQDNDDISVSIAAASSDADDMADGIQVGEGRSAMFTVTLGGADGGSSSAVTVPYTIGGDVEAADLTGISSLTNNTFAIAANQGSAILAIPLAVDADTASEDLTVTLGEGSAGYAAAGTIARSTTGQSATVKVVDRTDARALTLIRFDDSARGTESTAATVTETDAALMLYYRIGFANLAPTAFTSATPVTWAITHGTTNDDDFSATSGTVTFAMGATTAQDFAIAIAGDNLNEASETFTVGLSLADDTTDSGTNADATSGITIADDDAIALTDTSSGSSTANEGGNATVTVSLGAIPATDVMVAYTIGMTAAADDVDAAAADYASGNSITIAAGTNPPTGVISIAIAADNLNESAETFTVNVAAAGVSGHSGTATGAVDHTVTIAASDPLTASIAAPAPATVDEGQSATFPVTLSAASAADVVVAYTADGTTDTPTDANSGSITIAAGDTTGNIVLAIPINASLDEDSQDQTLTVTLASVTPDAAAGGGTGSVAAAPNDSAAVTVSYLEAAHRFAFDSPAMSIAEGAATTYTVTRRGPAIIGANIVVSWTYAAGAANPAAAADFMGDTAPAGGALTYAGSETSKTFTVTTKQDTLNEAGETFTLGLSATPAVLALASEGGVTLGNAATVTIADDDTIGVEITANDADDGVAEDGSTGFTVELSGGTRTAAVVVPFTASGLDNAKFDITAPSGIDASALGGSVTFTTADTTVLTATITVDLLDDDLNEADETLAITGGDATSAGAVAYTAGGRTATVTVTDDDSLVAHLALSNPATGGVDEGGSATFTVTLRTGAAATANPGTSAGAICVPFSTEVTGQQTAMPAAANGAGNSDIALVAPHNGACDDRNTALTPAAADGSATASVEIPARSSSATFSIQARNDGIDEGATAETLRVTLGTPVARIGAGDATANATAASVNINNVNATPARQADVNDDGSLDRNDAAIMYYAYAVRGLDADNTSDADLRHLLLRGLMPRSARGNDTAYQTALRLAAAWRAMGTAGGRDINGDMTVDRNDAAIMYYAYAVRGLDADNTSDADLRHLLLRGLMPRSARGNDTAYQTALARALQLRMPQQGSRNDEGSRDALRRAVELR